MKLQVFVNIFVVEMEKILGPFYCFKIYFLGSFQLSLCFISFYSPCKEWKSSLAYFSPL